MKMLWQRGVLRSPEGEGAGGTSSYDGEGASSAPDIGSRLSAFEGRLGEMARLIGDVSNSQRQRDAVNELQRFEDSLNQRITDTANAVTSAEAALAEAFDSGDGSVIARAQRVLSEAVNGHEQSKLHLSNYQIRRREEERRQGGGEGAAGRSGQPAAANNLDTTNLNAWKAKHRAWYGVDEEMTDKAHEINQRIRNAGAISVGSTEYFETIDREMRRNFPDRFGGTPQTAAGGGGNAPRAANTSGGRISQSVVDGWRRMGINVDDRATIERMIGHRATLVDKGILNQTPVYDRVKER